MSERKYSTIRDIDGGTVTLHWLESEGIDKLSLLHPYTICEIMNLDDPALKKVLEMRRDKKLKVCQEYIKHIPRFKETGDRIPFEDRFFLRECIGITQVWATIRRKIYDHTIKDEELNKLHEYLTGNEVIKIDCQ